MLIPKINNQHSIHSKIKVKRKLMNQVASFIKHRFHQKKTIKNYLKKNLKDQ